MNGFQIAAANSMSAVPASTNWKIVGTGDFNTDGKTGLLWQNTATGAVGIWETNGFQIAAANNVATIPPSSHWQIAGTGELLR